MPSDNVVWQALPGSQSLFLSCPIPEILYHGTRGPGKTDGLLMKYCKYVGQGFGEAWRGIIFRQTYKQLEDLIAKSKRWLKPAYPRAKYNSGKYYWEWPSGEQLFLRHMDNVDDYWNYHGHEYPFVGWEELTNWLTLDCYEVMKACNRSSHNDPRMPRIYAATCNPFGRGHAAVKRYFISPAPDGSVIVSDTGERRVAIHGSVLENTALLQADPSYIKKLDSISDPNRRKAWRFGSWDITAGGMFDDLWSVAHHVCPAFKIPDEWAIDRGHDWGSSRPSATLWYAESNGEEFEEISDEPGSEGQRTGRTLWYPKGHLFVIDEYYTWTGEENVGTQAQVKDIAKRILKIEEKRGWTGRVKPGPADSSIFSGEPGEKTIATKFAEAGVHFVPAFKGPGSRINGWQLIRELLDNAIPTEVNEWKQEEPGLTVFRRCVQTQRTLPVAPRDVKEPDDVDTESEDHIPDTVRYRALARKHRITHQGLNV